MRYLPYEESRTVPNIVVRGRKNERTVLVLSNLPNSGTPSDFKADTNTEIVLFFLHSPLRFRFSEISTVTSNKLSVDGILAVWGMLYPLKALANEQLLKAAARTSEFHYNIIEEGMCLALTLEAMLNQTDSAIKETSCSESYKLLPEIEELITNPAKFKEILEPILQQIQEDHILLISKGHLSEFPHVDLAVFDLPREIHPLPLLSKTKCHRILIIFPESKYLFFYKYETWIEMNTYTPPPRIDLTSLALQLQEKENHLEEGSWKWNSVSSPTPSLKFTNQNGLLAKSSISPQAFLARLIRFFEDSEENQHNLWTPKDWTDD